MSLMQIAEQVTQDASQMQLLKLCTALCSPTGGTIFPNNNNNIGHVHDVRVLMNDINNKIYHLKYIAQKEFFRFCFNNIIVHEFRAKEGIRKKNQDFWQTLKHVI